MAFIADKEQLKPGLIIFRRSDVEHRNFYCRVKLPKVDRYKTVSLKTADISGAREKAFEYEMEVRLKIKNDLPVFNRSFATIADEYLQTQRARHRRGEVGPSRIKNIETMLGPLVDYVGSTQVHLIGPDMWTGYPAWRRTNGLGLVGRCGFRERTEAEKREFLKAAADARAKRMRPGARRRMERDLSPEEEERRAKYVAIVSDATILSEMSIFAGVMRYAISKGHVPAHHAFGPRPKLKEVRREEFTVQEYRKLHTVGRKWIKDSKRSDGMISRQLAYNFILIMCNTGMRPPEASNLRWRDISTAKDKEGRDLVVMFVRGKGKQRSLSLRWILLNVVIGLRRRIASSKAAGYG